MRTLPVPFRACWVVMGAAMLLAAAPADAQVPVHKHYEQPQSFDAPAASGAIAPRLQNVGNAQVHGRHLLCPGTAVHAPGPEPDLRIQSRRSRSCLCGSGPARSGLRDGAWGQALVLGPNINAPMAPEEEPKARRADRQGRGTQRQGFPGRTRLHRCARGALHRQGG